RPGDADVLAVVGDRHVQAAVVHRGGTAGPVAARLAGPAQGGRDLEVPGARRRGHLTRDPGDPLVQDRLDLAVLGQVVVLGPALHAPRLHAEPVVARRVVVDRLPVVEHAVERRRTGGRGAVLAVDAV